MYYKGREEYVIETIDLDTGIVYSHEATEEEHTCTDLQDSTDIEVPLKMKLLEEHQRVQEIAEKEASIFQSLRKQGDEYFQQVFKNLKLAQQKFMQELTEMKEQRENRIAAKLDFLERSLAEDDTQSQTLQTSSLSNENTPQNLIMENSVRKEFGKRIWDQEPEIEYQYEAQLPALSASINQIGIQKRQVNSPAKKRQRETISDNNNNEQPKEQRRIQPGSETGEFWDLSIGYLPPVEPGQTREQASTGSTTTTCNRNWKLKPSVQIIKGHTSFVNTLIELKDGSLASGSRDDTIKIWDRLGNCLKTLKGHAFPVTALIELKDGSLASGSNDQTIKIWNRSGNCLKTITGHTDSIWIVTELKDGSLASGSTDKTIKIWDRLGNCLKTLTGHTKDVRTLIELKDGSLASGSWDHTIKTWDRLGNCLNTLQDKPDKVHTLIELKDGSLACGSNDKTIKIWNRELWM